MNFLLFPIGSSGDINPFVGIGIELKSRGHSVSVAANPYFRSLIDRPGLQFIPLGTRERYDALLNKSDTTFEGKDVDKILAESLLDYMSHSYEIAREFVRTENSVVVASCVAFGARLAQEISGAPLITIALSPMVIPSVDSTPVYPGRDFSRWPRWLRRAMYRRGDIKNDELLNPPFNEFRRQLGLKPAHNILGEWMYSPLLSIGLWPEWFAPPQRDWPPHFHVTDFPLYDAHGVETMPAALESFLNEGPPPVVFTPGTSVRHGKLFFEESVEACRRTGDRGVLLTIFPDQVPTNLPSSVQAFNYVPFSLLLPKCAALIHAGGIGSTSQAFAAGIPQIIMPITTDQPDNAFRVQRLGAGLTLAPKNYQRDKIAKILFKIKKDPLYRQRAQEIRQRLHGGTGIARACDLIEQATTD
jgi:rhamnosyltransferase subunit B